ncbi:hypothetical protein BsWGS_13680 [Bradybaena similaris]
MVAVHVPALQITSDQDICEGIRNRFVCDKQNPTLFHICLGSNKYTMVCPDALHFNVKTQKCDWPGPATCSSKPPLESASPYVSRLFPKREHNSSASTKTGYSNTITDKQKVTSYRPQSNPQKSEVTYVKPDNLKLASSGNDVTKSSKTEHSNKDLRSGRVYVNQSKSVPTSAKFEPYASSYHRNLPPSEGIILKTKIAELRSDKDGRLQNENNSVTSKEPTKTAATTKAKYPHSGHSRWQSNKISKTSNAHQKAQFNVENNSIKSHSKSTSNTSVTSRTRKSPNSQGRTDQLSTTSLHRSSHPPNRRFRPRVSQQNQVPQTYSARLSPFRKSPWNSLSRSSEHSDNNKRTDTQNTKTNGNTAVHAHTTKQPLKSSQKLESAKKRKGISLVKTPWWSTRKSDARSATTYKTKHSPVKHFQKWHNTVDTDDIKESPAISNLHTQTEPKGATRQHKRKFKPRNSVAKPSYNTRTPFESSHNGDDKPTFPSRSQVVKKHAKSPASVDSKPHLSRVNAAAASSDIKSAVYQSNDLIENIKSQPAAEIVIVPSETEDDRKEKEKPTDESSVEKYSAKRSKCSSSWCKLPACRCVGSDIPGGLEVLEVPQMVMLTFDDSINIQNVNFYKELFNGSLKNPNGCPVKSTFFVSGDNSDYQMVKKLFKQGHEIASHTLSHRSPTTWWADAGFQNWESEIVGMKKQLHEKAGVRLKDIVGMRAPFLQLGGDGQFAMLKENKFRFDSSMVTGYLYSHNNPPIWPFTLDTPPDSTTCNIPPCPTGSYPGLWEVPLIRWYGSNHIACAMPDACTTDSGPKNIQKFMDLNFNRHYKTNRAPFGIFIHASWFSRTEGVFEALKDFLRSLTNKEDVWVVTISQMLDWVQHPVRLSALNAIESWAC